MQCKHNSAAPQELNATVIYLCHSAYPIGSDGGLLLQSKQNFEQWKLLRFLTSLQ